MSVNNISKEELLNTFQGLSKRYHAALIENADLGNLKKLYVELRELKWRILEFGYVTDYKSISLYVN